MKRKIKSTVERAKQNPVLRESAKSLKPEANLWGFVGVFIFFILPEIVAFIWGKAITAFAHQKAIIESEFIVRKFYWLLEKLFEDGGSWFNLSIGVIIIVWMVYDLKNS